MTPNSLSPSYAVIDYVSAYGAHKATIPTLQWNVGIGTNGFGGYTGHDGVTSWDAETLWLAFIEDFEKFFLATTTFNSVTLYNKADEDAPSIPVAIIPVNEVGSSAETTQAKAAMSTWNFRTTAFNRFKLVALDAPVASGFARTLPAAWGANDLAILGHLSDLTKPFAGRDGMPIQSGISKTYTMSDVLRRRYGM